MLVASAQGSFFEDFSSGWNSRWTHSSESKYNGKFVVEEPEGLDTPALKVPEKARHYGLVAKLDKPVKALDGLVLQFELKLSEGLTCGGAYLKYLTAGEFEVTGLKDDTPYTVMFGPDKCGSTNKVHLILRHKSPSGKIEEKHLKSPPLVNLDKKTHVYTAILSPTDNTYDVLIDGESKKSGSLFDDFEPSINPAEEIDDPNDEKPSDWVENPKIPDPESTKPDDWDEDAPRQIEDPDAEKPEGWLDDEPAEVDDPDASQPGDWDEEEDGEWEPPKIQNPKCQDPGCGEWKPAQIPNPAYKGKWSPELIDNPEYKGVWKPRKIANPDYFVDKTPLKNLGDVGGVAIEIWTMDEGYFFDNVLVGSDADEAEKYRVSEWAPKKDIEDKLAEEEAARLKDEPKSDLDDDDEETETFADKFIALFDRPPLDKFKEQAAPFLDWLEEHPNSIWLIIAGPIFVLLSIVRRLFFGKKRRTTTATSQPTTRQAKKSDVTGPDDAVASAKGTAAQASDAVRSAAGAAQAKVSDAAATAADAVDDEEPKTRLRTRRDA